MYLCMYMIIREGCYVMVGAIDEKKINKLNLDFGRRKGRGILERVQPPLLGNIILNFFFFWKEFSRYGPGLLCIACV